MRIIQIHGFAILCAILSASTCNTLAQERVNTTLMSNLDVDIQELMREGDIPGLSIVLIVDGETIIKNYGYQDIRTKKPVDANTLFELGSCSKAFTALAVYTLVSQHKIDLDAPVSEYINWFHVYYGGKAAKITVRQLLHHTSGIPWNTISRIPQTNSDNALEQTIKLLVGQELNNTPGTAFEYATINYDVLALIIERVTQQPFESYLQENVFHKLNLKSTTIGNPIDGSLMATGHKIGFFDERVYSAPVFKGNNAAGYVISNTTDMGKWIKFQMGLLTTPLYEQTLLTHQRDETVPLHGMSSYGSGWEVALDGTGEISHAGLNPNFTAHVVFRPQLKIGVAVLANSNSTYTSLVANRAIKRLTGEEIANEFDPGDNSDKIFSCISFAFLFYIVVVSIAIIRIIVLTIRGERKYEEFTLKRTAIFARAVLAILPFLYGLYILPEALAGFTWTSILIWTPNSFAVLVSLLLTAVVLSYCAYLISLLFPDPNKYKQMAPQIVLLSVLSGLSNVIVIILVTSSISAERNLKYLIFYYGLALAVYLLGRRFVQINLIRITRGLVYDLRIQLIDKIFSTSYQRFEKIERGRVYTVLNDDINTVGESTNTFMLLITSIITATGAFVYLASIAFWATLLTIFLIVTLASIYYFVAMRTNRYFMEAREEQNIFMTLISGMIDGFKEISLQRNKKMAFKNDIASSANTFKKKLTTADVKFVNAFLVGESLLVVLLGMVSFGMPALFQNIQAYTVLSFVIVLLYLIGPINGILGSVPSLMHLKVAWNRIQAFLKEIPANLDLKEVTKPIDTDVRSITAEGITFEYQNEDEKYAFEIGPIDFEARKGEIVFIIGGNGSGKTTLAKLLTGLYEPNQGVIKINGKVVTNTQLSECFSTVFSPAYLFKKLYNIDIAQKSNEIEKYLSLLNLTNKVEITEKGYSTIDLSGGQRKRLALLQCYLEDSPIYLFDEWAADQDPSYRNFFYRTLLPEMKEAGKIIIAITHDDHYFDVADKIVKMKHGKLEVYSDEHPFNSVSSAIEIAQA